ncbi:MAG TPA: LuxR C-terminal-related transcriptional regulator [Chloroflexota bacterium]|nr:LuxR C-terminal-related transcriptional regulator [Chloroflexota bacterium]
MRVRIDRTTTSLAVQELCVLQLLARGYTTRQIAQLVGELPDAVEGLIASATRQLGVSTRAEAVAAALQCGLIV